MFLPCWRALGSLALILSPTTLKEFEGHGFQPHRLLKSFVVTLKGKIFLVDIKVVDAPLDYNFLLGHSWFYVMIVIACSVFRILQFLHQRNIIIVDQLEYITPYLNNVTTNNVPFLGQNNFESVGVGLLKDFLSHGGFSFSFSSHHAIFHIKHGFDLGATILQFISSFGST